MVISGQLHGAEKEILTYLDQDETHADVWSILADCRRKAKNFEGAVEAYRQVLAHGSAGQSLRAHFLIGEIYQDHLGDHEKAVESFGAFLDASWEDDLYGKVLLRFAKSKMALGANREASEALEKIVNGPYKQDLKSRADSLLMRFEPGE